MGFLDFFKSKNQKEISLDDLFYGLEVIADFSYKNFLESFGFSEKHFGETTKFETYVAVLFYFDYSLASEKLNISVRNNFFELAINMIEDKFSKKLSNNDLQEIINYRYTEYSRIPMEIGNEWVQSFLNLYEVKLKGTEDTDTIEKLPAIVVEDVFEQLPKKTVFIRDEIGNFIKTRKLVKEIFSGKDLSMIIKEIEILDLKAKKEFQK